MNRVSHIERISFDRYIGIAVSAIAGFIILRTMIVPVLQLGFFSDDFAFLIWTSKLDTIHWLAGFFEPGHFNLTYRPLAAVIYLVYLSGSATAGYLFLAALFAANSLTLFLFYRRLANTAIAALAILIFLASFIYFDATHKIYNLITQASGLFFLISLHCFLDAQDGTEAHGRRHVAAYVFYGLSLLTYEITVFGFVVFFVLALRLVERDSIAASSTRAFRFSFGFVALSLFFLIINLLSPIKAAHLRDHAMPLTLFSIPTILWRGWEVLKNTCGWILTALRPEYLRAIDTPDLALSLLLVPVLTVLIVRGVPLITSRLCWSDLRVLRWLSLLCAVWFLVFLLPGAFSTYFDYRMTFFAYAGLSLTAAAILNLIYTGVIRIWANGSASLHWGLAGGLAALTGIWLTSNVALADRMNAHLIGAANQQSRILAALQPYAAGLSGDSVIVVRYDHQPSHMLPYPYMASPFAEDYALRDATQFHLSKTVQDASLFFRPDSRYFEIGRFGFARNTYPYEKLALFDVDRGRLALRTMIKVAGQEIDLPLGRRLSMAFARANHP